MAEADVEPVFKTRRQLLVRDVLTGVAACAVLWLYFLGVSPGLRETALLVGGGVLAPALVVAHASGVLSRPDHWIGDLLASVAVTLATFLLVEYAPTETAWTGFGAAVGALVARLLLYATGAWRPGDPP